MQLIKDDKSIRKQSIFSRILICVITITLSLLIVRNAYFEYKYNLIYQEIDSYCDLDNDEKTDYDKINDIRDWVYHNIVFSAGRETLIEPDPFNINVIALTLKARMVRLFELRSNYKGGFYCAGIADTLTTTYRVLGYDAYRIDVDVDGHTHCMTVVYCDAGWVLEDATFNYSFVDEKDDPLYIDRIIEDIDANDEINVVLSEGKYTEAYAISVYDIESYGSYPIISTIHMKNNRYMYLVDRRACNYDAFYEMYNVFEKDGYERNMKYMLKYVTTVVRFYSIEDIIDYSDTMNGVNALRKILHVS